MKNSTRRENCDGKTRRIPPLESELQFVEKYTTKIICIKYVVKLENVSDHKTEKFEFDKSISNNQNTGHFGCTGFHKGIR